METLSELQRENRELLGQKELLELRQENRRLNREIERLKSGKNNDFKKHVINYLPVYILAISTVLMFTYLFSVLY